MKAVIARLAQAAGYEIRRKSPYRSDFSAFEREVLDAVREYTMASPERVVAVIDAVRYIVEAKLPGAIVECGVYRGGCVMAAALTLKKLGDGRDIYLFDTFAGMSEPTEFDRKVGGELAMMKFEETRTDDGSDWCYASMEEVRKAMLATQYPMERVHLVKGKVEETLPQKAPEAIALLRLDTDWYESTKHELTHLYPRLVKSGVLIIDDYGSWEGARKAVDEYFDAKPILLNRTDGQGRMAVKP